MTQVRIINRAQRDFGMVPRALWSAVHIETGEPVSFTAKGVMAFLMCLQDGALPYVAEMEQQLGLGRDARRKAFAELERLGAIRWLVQRRSGGGYGKVGAILAKTLEILPDGVGVFHGPENQAHGAPEPEKFHAPEIQAGGQGVGAATESRRASDARSGDTSKEEKKKRVAQARLAARPPLRSGERPAPDAGTLTAFERSRVLAGQSVVVSGQSVRPGSAIAEALAHALRAQNAENGRGAFQ